jgi:biotin carboxylase
LIQIKGTGTKEKVKGEEARKKNVRRVLLLSTTTGYQLRSFESAAKTLGIELVFATDRCNQLDDPWRDRAIPVRFHHEWRSLDAVIKESKRTPFDGVLAVGDRPTVMAARVAERLNLPGNPPDAAAASGNKRETRARLAAAGLPAPWYFTLGLREAAHVASEHPRLQFPCVLKPLGLSGSRGVIRADSREEFIVAFERIRALLSRLDVRAARTGLEDVVLVEGFIHGREFAVEGILTGGVLQVFAIFDKPDPLEGPFFEETLYVTPSSLGALTQVKVMSAVQDAVDALGLHHGPIHAECRVGPDGIFILEVAARPIGGLCSRVLKFDDGASLEEVLLRHAAGEDVSSCVQDARAAAVMMIPIPKRGLLKGIDGEEAARRVPFVEDIRITAKRDQLLEQLPEAGSYLGFIFARADYPPEAERAVREAHRLLTFDIADPIKLATSSGM